MAKFKFRLASLKRYRETRLMMARKELFEVESRLQSLRERVEQSHSHRAALLEEGEGTLSLSTRQINVDLVESETKRIFNLKREIQLVEEEQARHSRWVVHLGRELKAIEKLEENQYKLFTAEQLRLEKRTMDNWAAERWGRDGTGGDAA